ncbi:MAG TPA: hypothetical protein VKY66_02755 [Protaetiibacter sp.]|nr:hypothetical protein [Protaetiibacter sp.]
MSSNPTPAPSDEQAPAQAPTPQQPTPTPTPQPPQQQAAQAQPQPEQPAREATDWKAEARKWEERAKKNAEAARQLEELERQRPETEKLAQRLRELETELEERRKREQVAAWAAEVSEETGVPAGVLRGSTLDELKAHAAELKSLLTPAQQGAQPVPGVSQAPHGKPGNIPLADQIRAAEEAGDRDTAAALKAVLLGQAFQTSNNN